MSETILKILAMRDKTITKGGKNIESKGNIQVRETKKRDDTTRVC